MTRCAVLDAIARLSDPDLAAVVAHASGGDRTLRLPLSNDTRSAALTWLILKHLLGAYRPDECKGLAS